MGKRTAAFARPARLNVLWRPTLLDEAQASLDGGDEVFATLDICGAPYRQFRPGHARLDDLC